MKMINKKERRQAISLKRLGSIYNDVGQPIMGICGGCGEWAEGAHECPGLQGDYEQS